jgi:hypothetical protein
MLRSKQQNTEKKIKSGGKSSQPPAFDDCLNSQQFDLDVTGFGTEVDHGTVAVHCGTGVDNLHTIDFHDAAGLMDVGAAHDIE